MYIDDALDTSYDYNLAAISIQYYFSYQVPSVNREIPPGVSHIKFKSDLNHINNIDICEIKKYGNLLDAL